MLDSAVLDSDERSTYTWNPDKESDKVRSTLDLRYAQFAVVYKIFLHLAFFLFETLLNGIEDRRSRRRRTALVYRAIFAAAVSSYHRKG